MNRWTITAAIVCILVLPIARPALPKTAGPPPEVGVVNRMSFPAWKVLEGARFAKGDPQYEEWARHNTGVYATNGAVLAAIKRSTAQRPLPDLFCFALLGLFRGYFPGYSALFPRHLSYLTWAVLKAHTNNRSGEVTLRSSDPRDVPNINFRYFEEGSDRATGFVVLLQPVWPR